MFSHAVGAGLVSIFVPPRSIPTRMECRVDADQGLEHTLRRSDLPNREGPSTGFSQSACWSHVFQLFEYVWRQNINQSTRTIYYFDILASKQILEENAV